MQSIGAIKKRPASTLNPGKVQTPAFVIEEDLLKHNLERLQYVSDMAGCTILLAMKAWATWPLFGMVKKYLSGVEVSSLNEARLGFEEFGQKVHIYSPAYKPEEFHEILKNCSHVIFNSFAQWRQFRRTVKDFSRKNKKNIECGLRINPEMSFGEGEDMYNPCAVDSRLGVRLSEFEKALAEDPKVMDGLSGIHFHIFFERDEQDLEKALYHIEKRFGKYLKQLKWVNFGGGQKITDDNYDVEALIRLIKNFKKKYGVEVHLEPGAAVVWQSGTLVASVLDIIESEDVPYSIAILDISFEAHLTDFMLTPSLNLRVRGAVEGRENKYVYQFGGCSCLAGDRREQLYSFSQKLKVGDRVVFEDGIQYSLVKTTMFNGIQHPDIVLWKKIGKEYAAKRIRKFEYEDFKKRMG
ncbi:carboxynorspermidine decarboxylase [Candidatus Peregrinibacteria bacterium]|nr:carboxynorspermidine decarboxylase [Candidatus Peregrinibacteria bacterium]